MTREQILATIKTLACSQGTYGRIYNWLVSGDESAEEWLVKAEEQNFKDAVDLVLAIEG